MFKKLLSSVGIGAAKVDTILPHNKVMPGDDISGYVHLKGGSVSQNINGIQIQLYTTYKSGNGMTEDILKIYDIEGRTTIEENEERKIPFTLYIPPHTPVSFGNQKIYLKTLVSVSSAVDPHDFDLIEVVPHPIMSQIIREVEFLGFKHSHESGECVIDVEGINDFAHFVQEFEFKPVNGEFLGVLDEVEIKFIGNEDGIDIYMQVDKFGNTSYNDESFVHVHVDYEEGIEEGEIERIIRKYS